ncbi:MAG: hypothetical protein ABIO86_17645 [Sphingomonas sp.]
MTVNDPQAKKYVAAIEIPIVASADRNDLLAILRSRAPKAGLHMDDLSERLGLYPIRDENSSLRSLGTIYVGIWHGKRDNDLEVVIGDAGHPGRAWVGFLRGKKPVRAERFRQDLTREIRKRWPLAQLIPVLPSGGLPSADDLLPTESGYKIATHAGR